MRVLFVGGILIIALCQAILNLAPYQHLGLLCRLECLVAVRASDVIPLRHEHCLNKNAAGEASIHVVAICTCVTFTVSRLAVD